MNVHIIFIRGRLASVCRWTSKKRRNRKRTLVFCIVFAHAEENRHALLSRSMPIYSPFLSLFLVAVVIMLIAVGVQRDEEGRERREERQEEIFEWIYLDNEWVHLSFLSVPFVFSIDWTWIKRTNEEDNIVHPHMYAGLNSHRHEKRNNRKRLSDRCTSTEQTGDGDIHDASSRRVDGCCYSCSSIAERREKGEERHYWDFFPLCLFPVLMHGRPMATISYLNERLILARRQMV